MSKKILIASILVMTMIFSFATMSYAANTPTITVDNVSGSAGGTVTVEINVSNNPGFIQIIGNVKFDNEYLNIVSYSFDGTIAAKGSAMPKTSEIESECNPNGYCLLEIGDDGAEENYADDGLLLSITFKLLQDVAADNIAAQPKVTIKSTLDADWDEPTFEVVNEAPAGGETFETWIGGTRYENNKFLAIVKYSGNATEYGIRFDDFDFVAQEANKDNIFAIEVEDVETDPTSGVTAFAR